MTIRQLIVGKSVVTLTPSSAGAMAISIASSIAAARASSCFEFARAMASGAASRAHKKTTERISRELTRAGARFLPMSYEALFGARTPPVAELNRIAGLFGVEPFAGRDRRLAAVLAQGERQTSLSSLYRDSADVRKLDERFGERFGFSHEREASGGAPPPGA